MTWSDFYLLCFLVGFSLSVLSFLAGAVHIHLPFRHSLAVSCRASRGRFADRRTRPWRRTKERRHKVRRPRLLVQRFDASSVPGLVRRRRVHPDEAFSLYGGGHSRICLGGGAFRGPSRFSVHGTTCESDQCSDAGLGLPRGRNSRDRQHADSERMGLAK